MPILYPCFYSSVNNELLACASASNPSQRCPVGYTLVGETVYCQPNLPAPTQTTVVSVPAKKTVLSLPRTGGTSGVFATILVVVLVLSLVLAVRNLFVAPKH